MRGGQRAPGRNLPLAYFVSRSIRRERHFAQSQQATAYYGKQNGAGAERDVRFLPDNERREIEIAVNKL